VSNTLILSDNSKTKFRKSHYNTFGLNYGLPKNGGTCPGATLGAGGCLDVRDGHKRETCYMAKVTSIYKAVGNVLQSNTDLLKNKSVEEMTDILTNTINQFIKKNPDKKNWFFRLHYSGDFFSEDYARAWAATISKFPEVRFWVYTRSHECAKYFTETRNLTFYFSVDPVNYKKAIEVYGKYKKYPHYAMAWMGNNAPDQETHRWVTCPETSGKLRNTPDNGACARCRLCVDNYVYKVKNIRFEIH